MQNVQTINLNEGDKNVFYVIEFIDCKNIPVSRRLTELGFVKGAKLKIIQFSALKKTVLVQVGEYVLSLRASVAEFIKVKK
jgi:Fe2+ transport system protein FeoA